MQERDTVSHVSKQAKFPFPGLTPHPLPPPPCPLPSPPAGPGLCHQNIRQRLFDRLQQHRQLSDQSVPSSPTRWEGSSGAGVGGSPAESVQEEREGEDGNDCNYHKALGGAQGGRRISRITRSMEGAREEAVVDGRDDVRSPLHKSRRVGGLMRFVLHLLYSLKRPRNRGSEQTNRRKQKYNT